MIHTIEGNSVLIKLVPKTPLTKIWHLRLVQHSQSCIMIIHHTPTSSEKKRKCCSVFCQSQFMLPYFHYQSLWLLYVSSWSRCFSWNSIDCVWAGQAELMAYVIGYLFGESLIPSDYFAILGNNFNFVPHSCWKPVFPSCNSAFAPRSNAGCSG